MTRRDRFRSARRAALCGRLATPVLLMAVVLASSGCASGPPPPEEVRRHMFDSFWRLGSVPGRLIVGDLDGVALPARWLARQVAADELLLDADQIDHFQRLAMQIEAAPTVPDAARAASRLAAECGSCHEAEGAGPDFGHAEALQVGPRLSTHMLRHLWAMDRMWEGLVAGSTAQWDRGARILTEDPLPFLERLEDRPEVPEYARRIHTLGERAMAAEAREERAGIYADLLGTCAACHQRMEVPSG